MPAPARARTPPTDGATIYSATIYSATIYSSTCATCHPANVEGVPERYLPLAGNEWVAGDQGRRVRVVLHGVTRAIEVQGETYPGAMPGWAPTLDAADLAAVRTHFGTTAAPVSAVMVA